MGGDRKLSRKSGLFFSLCSEEVFDFSAGQMTQTKTLVMKDTLCQEFSKVFQLCSYVLVSAFNSDQLGFAGEAGLLAFLERKKMFLRMCSHALCIYTCVHFSLLSPSK